MNYIENIYFPKYGQSKEVNYKYLLYKQTDPNLPNVIAFKNYAAREHKIFLYV